MRNAAALALVLTGCISESFHPSTNTTFPPIADRALASPEPVGQKIGSLDSAGPGIASQSDLADDASLTAARAGGTHIVTVTTGVATSEVTTPASQSTTCTDNTDQSTCTTTYTPESTTTVTSPYATFDVYRVERDRWAALAPEERPTWDPSLHVPSAADGWGLSFGGFSAPFPGSTSGTSGSVFPTYYTANVPALEGLWVSSSHVSGSNELSIDMRFGGTSYTGIAQNTQMNTQPAGFTGTIIGTAGAIRLGKRISWDNFALAAGVGLAGAIWTSTISHSDPGTPIESTFVEPGPGATVDFYAPVWASLTVKPSCNWGVQALAEYDVRSDTDQSTPSLSLGMIWQPATACF